MLYWKQRRVEWTLTDGFRDQELRFRVHDSADYRQLKVSVFNDDKRTDLIGETWVNLEDILQRGGGRADGWHPLNCKGKYAGEIRIELTYYDTRPKEERPAETRRESVKSRPQQGSRDSLGGPRQPKPVTRRPLPADPVQAPSSIATDIVAPLPLRPTPPRAQPQAARQPQPVALPLDHYAQPAMQPYPQDEPSHPHLTRQPIHAVPTPYVEEVEETESPSKYAPEPVDMFAPTVEDGNSAVRRAEHRPAPHHGYGQETYQPMHDQPRQQPYYAPVDHNPEVAPLRAARQPSPEAPAPLTSSNSHAYAIEAPPPMRHHHSAPDHRQPPSHPYAPREERYDPYKVNGDSPQHVMQLRHQAYASDIEEDYIHPPLSDGEDVPPPPPAHRASDSQLALARTSGRYSHGHSVPVDPVSIGQSHDSRHSPHAPYASSPLSGNGFGYATSGHIAATPPSYEPPQRLPNHGGSFSESQFEMPPSLVPGYDSRTIVEHPARGRREVVDDGRWDGSPGHSTAVTSHRAYRPFVPPSEPVDIAPRRHEEIDPQRSSRTSVSAAGPPAASPEPLRVPRKSVSPRPSTGLEQTQTPFGPDAFDVLNPNAGSPGATEGGAQYRTPEEADRVAREHERGQQSNDPIIGSDGRVIDPSDHLPSSTWAPEPEPKRPSKAVLTMEARSRPSPQGAQAMPPSTRRATRDGGVARPHSIAGNVYGNDPHTPPDNTRRIRIQMKPRVPASASTTPTSTPHGGAYTGNHVTSTPRSMPKVSTAGHDDYARGGGGSPSYSPYGSTSAGMNGGGMGSPGDIHSQQQMQMQLQQAPPPIPAKLPMNTGPRDEYSALSEELSTINIGSTGRRVARRSYY